MVNYSIRELEHLSGIKAHTLRIWETRYGILKPQRTDTNIRYYTKQDLKVLLKIALLNHHGLRISKIAKMSEQELSEQVAQLVQDISVDDYQIHLLTNSMIDLNEEDFEAVVDANLKHRGFERLMLEIIYPFLEKIGFLWMAGSINPAQEHYMSNLIRHKVIVEIEALPKKIKTDYPHFLLFLPEGELHELSLLFTYYLLKARGIRTTYLGASIPIEDAIAVSKIKKVDKLFCICTSYPVKRKIQPFIEKLAQELPNQQIYLTGYQASRISFPLPSNCKVYHKVTDFIKIGDTETSLNFDDLNQPPPE